MKRLYFVVTFVLLSWTCKSQEPFRDGIFACYPIENDSTCVSISLSQIEGIADTLSETLVIPQRVRHKEKVYDVYEIGDNGFVGYQGENVIIPDGVKVVGENAFYGCSHLTSIEIPASVMIVKNGAIANCPNLEIVSVSNFNIRYDSRNNCNAVVETNSNKLIAGCSKTVIPASITSIGTRAFQDCVKLYDVIIPEGVKNIESEAFLRCYDMKTVRLPQSLVSIDGDAFNDCQSLSEVLIPMNVENIDYNPFSNCPGLNRIRVDARNKYYDSRDGCNAIMETASGTLVSACSNTIIPSSTKSIRMFAFKGLIKLSTITVPASVCKIDGGCIADCPNLTSIQVEPGNSSYDSRDNCNCIIETATNTIISGCSTSSFPNGIKAIGNYAFFGMMTKHRLELPKTLEVVGLFAFSGCHNLEYLVVPSSVRKMFQSFVGCRELKRVEFEDGITEIYPSSFSDCISLSSIFLPSSLKKIGSNAFSGCTRLRYMTFPSTLEYVGKNAFDGCLVNKK